MALHNDKDKEVNIWRRCTNSNVHKSNYKHTWWKLIEMEVELGIFTLITGKLHTHFSLRDERRAQTISKDVENLNISIQFDWTDICRIHNPVTIEYTIFSSTHKTFIKIDYILVNKTNINKIKTMKWSKVCYLVKKKLN